MKAKFLVVSDVAQLAWRKYEQQVTPECVRAWNRSGKLHAIRTASGMRLFRRRDVEKFLEARRRHATAREAREAGAPLTTA